MPFWSKKTQNPTYKTAEGRDAAGDKEIQLLAEASKMQSDKRAERDKFCKSALDVGDITTPENYMRCRGDTPGEHIRVGGKRRRRKSRKSRRKSRKTKRKRRKSRKTKRKRRKSRK